jgi:hypothetical protein
MKFILKSLLLTPSPKKLSVYQSHFHLAFKGRDLLFDEIFGAIAEFYHEFSEFPKPEVFLEGLKIDGQTKLSDYLTSILTDDEVQVYTEDSLFFAALEQEQQEFMLSQLFQSIRQLEKDLGHRKERGVLGITRPVDVMLQQVIKLKTSALRSETSISSLLFGAEDIGLGHSLPEIYKRNVLAHESENSIYFDIGIEKLNNAQLKDGDLVVFGGFTSHGKSILLRHMAYRQIYNYGRNTVFFSAEMSHDAVRALFALMHANNKIEYPDTPYIAYDSWKNGILTDEEKDFLFNMADYDLRNNQRYGTLYIEEPKSRLRLSDVISKIMQIETTIMPVKTVVFDYLTLMSPVEDNRGRAQREDFNELIKGFKNMLITHTNVTGEVAPMLGVTAHQISRGGLEACEKAEKHYEISAFSDHSEIEKSADHLFTCYMDASMRQTSQMKLQHLKNRDGVVIVDPCDVYVDFKHGLRLAEIEEKSRSERDEMLKTLAT